MVKVLVCGGRDFRDYARVQDVLGRLHKERGPITVLIQGGAKGADWMGAQWARSLGIPVFEFQAGWERHGKAAGSIRNQRMLDEGEPDLVLAFPGGRGTGDMVKRAEIAGFEVIKG